MTHKLPTQVIGLCGMTPTSSGRGTLAPEPGPGVM